MLLTTHPDDQDGVLLDDPAIIGTPFFLSLWSGEGSTPLRIHGAKLAAERYDPDDGLVRDSPPLVAQQVNLTPTPSPDYYPSESSASTSPRSKGQKRTRPQASQGDAVLINFMGGLNHPELATRAGEEPLPLSDDSEIGDPMEIDGVKQEDSKKARLVRLAEDALPLTEGHHSHDDGRDNALKIENLRPARPTVLTESRQALSKDRMPSEEHKSRVIRPSNERETYQELPERKVSRAATDGPSLFSRHGSRAGLSKSPSRSPCLENDSEQISHVLRRNTIPASQQSPTETLPPLQPQSSPANATKAPNNSASLPSLEQSNLKSLLNSKPPTDPRYKDLGRPQMPISSSLHSPPLGSRAPKPSPSYPSPQTRMNTTYGPAYSHGQPSPAPSDTSPRDPAVMSPPGRPGTTQFSQFHHSGKSTQSEGETPSSANSYPSSSSFSTAPSPQLGGEQMEVDRAGRILPPLVPHPGPPLMTGTFKCQFQGCTAAPFQTQYLLK